MKMPCACNSAPDLLVMCARFSLITPRMTWMSRVRRKRATSARICASVAGTPIRLERSPAMAARIAKRRGSAQRLDDLFGHLLGVAEEHHGVVAEEEFVLH